MNERQRQDYLEAMGIQPWFPRFVLPSAKASVACEWDYEDVLPVTAQAPVVHAIHAQQPTSTTATTPQTWGQQPAYNNPPASQPASRPAAGSLKDSSDILDELGFSPKVVEEEKTEVQTTESSQGDSTLAERFRLAVIDISETCLVVSDLPWSGLNQFTSYHQRLLANIVRALNIPSDQEWKKGLFTWPMIPGSPAVDQKYAQEAVHGYLNNQFGLQRRKTVFLFGQTSCHYLWSTSQAFENCHGRQIRDNVEYGITCSLGEMMGIPELKADVWANLKPLIRRPNSSE